MPEWLNTFIDDFKFVFIEKDRYMYLVKGIGTTLFVTFCATLIGFALGILIAIIRSTHDKIAKDMHPGIGKYALKFVNLLSKIYLTVIRGTPVMVQIMIAYFVIFASSNNKVLIAILSFGINSGAYVAEIVRSGIMSIDNGQFEAGRSLGFNYPQTMIFVILPQAFKNVLPALANEFIVLLKETSISIYVGLQELTSSYQVIQSQTYMVFMPLIAIAIIYLVVVIFFSKLISILERRLRKNER